MKATGIQDGVGYVGAYSWLDTNGYRDHSAAPAASPTRSSRSTSASRRASP
jgi:hypothetical protein